MRKAQFAALAAGILLFAVLVRRLGPGILFEDLRAIGWGLALVIVIELSVDAVNTLGWWFTFAPDDRRMGFGVLYLVRLAGTALNQTLPSASLGGEPVKALLLRPWVPLSHGFASVITAKLSYGIAQSAFVLAGLIAASGRVDLPRGLALALIGAFLLPVIGLALFFHFQRRGLFGEVARLMLRVGLPERWSAALGRASSRVDARIRDFYALQLADFGSSVACHLASFGLGVLQVWLLLRWMGIGADLIACTVIEALSLLIQLALFLVPGGIGVQEGGKVLIFTALGLPAAAGLSLGIALRLNQMAGVALGLAAFALLQWRRGETLAVPGHPPAAP
ncbi:MAG: hypothetical protein QOD06_394 [Candidatus Binatota bacterium]|nr:hypothetical protein [Candidatus Binatota bacterium]